MTTRRQYTKIFAFLVCACPTAEPDCPFLAVGVAPPAEAIFLQAEMGRKLIVTALFE
jgi:hypothetical protein